MWRVFRNTLVISGLNMTVGFVAPIVFALLLNEIHQTIFKKVIQTISYLPLFYFLGSCCQHSYDAAGNGRKLSMNF